jgi:hypothetical protein
LRLTLETVKVWRPVVPDSHNFDEEPDPDQTEKSDAKAKNRIRIRINLMRFRNNNCNSSNTKKYSIRHQLCEHALSSSVRMEPRLYYTADTRPAGVESPNNNATLYWMSLRE